MKISLALGSRQPLSRQTAWGCFTSNVAFPGSGSLLAGRVSGYFQLALGIVGLLITIIFGLRFILWQLANWSRYHSVEADPFASLLEMWQHLRFALLGLGIFFFAWVSALITSLSILQSARKAERSNAPPRLK